MSSKPFDDTKANEFADRLVATLNSGGLALLISIGHRTGLFDTMADQPPMTSQALADKAGLNERYVREWLGGLVTARVVDYDPAQKTYQLPAEHSAFMTRAASPNNIAAFLQYVAVLGTVEDKIVECFKQGGGLPYSEFPRFHEVMAEDSAQSVVSALFEHILPLAPDALAALDRGIEVLDIGCGSGYALCEMAGRFPNSKFVGYDLVETAVAAGRARAAERGLTNVTLEVRDVYKLGDDGRFDMVTAFDAVHDQAQPLAVLKNIHRALKPGGVFLMQDIAGSSDVSKNLEHPVGIFLYTVSCMHCMTVSLSAGGEGLGAMWGEEKAHEYLAKAGFADTTRHALAHDFQNYYYVSHKA
jgi:2-polyprenyl-3-methyl-5-hydroxy-6-metoxy-1,4-benzoquinol methylase